MGRNNFAARVRSSIARSKNNSSPARPFADSSRIASSYAALFLMA